MVNRRNVMQSAWRLYRRQRRTTFCRTTFAGYLRMASETAKYQVEVASQEVAKPAPVREMEARIEALAFLPFRYSVQSMEREIRAE